MTVFGLAFYLCLLMEKAAYSLSVSEVSSFTGVFRGILGHDFPKHEI